MTLPGTRGDGLLAWVERSRNRPAPRRGGALRFAFYGRVSTEDHQDPVTSRARQRAQAEALVAGSGRIVAEFFDVGESRVLPWSRRTQAAALVLAMADPDRAFDAIVVGEYERAFYGNQFSLMAPLFEHYGVQLWLPEAGGRVDFQAEGHERLMAELGMQSKREITRTRIRVRTAMAAQVSVQGRYLGGRPPYGYRLVDAGPHPNRAHAAWGRRAHRLEPDPATAEIVKWMFGRRLAGHSLARITRALNDMDIPCPSAADPQRNAHRSAARWTLTTVRAILANPRYTGHEVWNRQPSAYDLIDTSNTGLGHRQIQRWSLPEDWVISERPAHEALVSQSDFVAVQGIRAPSGRSNRTYRLAGLLRCGSCHRRLESCWSGNRAAYRCRHGHTSASHADPQRPKNLYVGEDHLMARLPALYLLLTGEPVGRAPGVEEIIGYLRARHIDLVYDRVRGALRADVSGATPVVVDRQAG
ncbi:recombinase family protein [Nonomuraea helvata]